MILGQVCVWWEGGCVGVQLVFGELQTRWVPVLWKWTGLVECLFLIPRLFLEYHWSSLCYNHWSKARWGSQFLLLLLQ